MDRLIIRFRTTRTARSPLKIPTPASIHEVRQVCRRTLVRVRVLRPLLGRRSFRGLQQSLGNLIDLTAESRDAQVQSQIIARFRAANAARTARDYRELAKKLQARKQAATAELARYLSSDAGGEHLRQLNEELAALESAQQDANLPPLATRRFVRLLHEIQKKLAHDIAPDQRAHVLRRRIRRARTVAAMFDAPGGELAKRLGRELNKTQQALGDWHDAMLLARWIEARGLTLAASVRARLDSRVKECLKRARHHRKPLRRAIRQFLKQAAL